MVANWLYYKNNRLILAMILFHFLLDAVAMTFDAEQFTKCITSLVFLIAAVLIVIFDRKAFSEGPKSFIEQT